MAERDRSDATRRPGDARAVAGPGRRRPRPDRGLAIDGTPPSWPDAFGTPLLVFDEDEIRATGCRACARGVPRVAYAVKAFTAHAVIRHRRSRRGSTCSCASGGEVEACLRAGVAGLADLLHGNTKSDDGAARSRSSTGVALVVVDHVRRAPTGSTRRRASRRVQPVLLRVIPEVEVETHEAIATGHEASKFGTPLADAAAPSAAIATLPGVRFDGLHAHIGSQVLDPAPFCGCSRRWSRSLRRSRDEAATTPVGRSTSGGGFGVTYVDERAARRRDAGANDAARDIDELAAAHAGSRAVARRGARAVHRRQRGGHPLPRRRPQAGRRRAGRCVAVDGGMSDNLRPMLYDARYAVAPASARRDGAARAVTVVGRHCESGDVLADDVELPATLVPGDLLAVRRHRRVHVSARLALQPVRPPGGRRRARRARAARGSVARTPPTSTGSRSRPRRGHRDGVAPPEGVAVRPARAARRGVVPRCSGRRSSRRAATCDRERVGPRAASTARRFRRSWTVREAAIVAVEGDAGGRSRLRPARAASGHPARRDPRDRGRAPIARRRGRQRAARRGDAVGARGRRREDRAVGVPGQHAPRSPCTAGSASWRKDGSSRQSRKAYGYEDEILMAALGRRRPGTGR